MFQEKKPYMDKAAELKAEYGKAKEGNADENEVEDEAENEAEKEDVRLNLFAIYSIIYWLFCFILWV